MDVDDPRRVGERVDDALIDDRGQGNVQHIASERKAVQVIGRADGDDAALIEHDDDVAVCRFVDVLSCHDDCSTESRRWRKWSQIWRRSNGSIPAVGSSRISTGGSWTSVAASASPSICMPPEDSRTSLRSSPVKLTSSRTSRTRRRRRQRTPFKDAWKCRALAERQVLEQHRCLGQVADSGTHRGGAFCRLLAENGHTALVGAVHARRQSNGSCLATP